MAEIDRSTCGDYPPRLPALAAAAPSLARWNSWFRELHLLLADNRVETLFLLSPLQGLSSIGIDPLRSIMAKRRRKVLDERGQSVEGTVVNVEETTERWTDVRLADGTTFRIKVVVDEVVQQDGRRDAEGNPVYSVMSHNVINDLQCVDTVRHITDK